MYLRQSQEIAEEHITRRFAFGLLKVLFWVWVIPILVITRHWEVNVEATGYVSVDEQPEHR